MDGHKAHKWVLKCAECAEFNVYRISHIGMAEAMPPYRIVRLQPTGSFLLATTEGEGHVMLDGKWQRVTAGSLVMAPPRVLNAFHVPAQKKWNFAYVRYDEPSYVRAMVGADSPVRAPAGGGQLARCIAGLREEWGTKRIHKWFTIG